MDHKISAFFVWQTINNGLEGEKGSYYLLTYRNEMLMYYFLEEISGVYAYIRVYMKNGYNGEKYGAYERNERSYNKNVFNHIENGQEAIRLLIKPQKLQRGDKVATISPSWGGAGDANLRWRYEQGVERLKTV